MVARVDQWLYHRSERISDLTSRPERTQNPDGGDGRTTQSEGEANSHEDRDLELTLSRPPSDQREFRAGAAEQ
jgi:hypothetical protein